VTVNNSVRFRTTRRPPRSSNRPAAMNFTDIFIRRPVLSIVISLAILVIGVRALMELPVRQYPVTQNAVVTISTA